MHQTWSVCTIISIIIGLLATIVSIGMLAGGYNALYNTILHAKMQVKPGKEVEYIWENIPVPLEMRVFLFNITNPDEFLEGEIPELEEVGPYVYREYHHKENMTYHPNMTVTYYQKRWWMWDQEKSANCSLDDAITTLNAISVSAAFTVQDNPISLSFLNSMMVTMNETAIVRTTASEILFDGYEDPLLDFIQEFAVNEGESTLPFPPGMLDYDKFAWFYNKNNSITFDGVYNMYTGESSLDDVGLIDWWNYSNETNYFDAPCNEVTGTTGEIWPPGIGKNFIQFYNSDLCMSMKLYYLKDIEDSFGNPGYRFWGSNETFSDECFCIAENCFTGLLSAQSCRMGAPAYISFPHFYNGDPALIEGVKGIKPDPDKHEFFLDINPDLGVPLLVAARLQINMQVKPYPGEGFLNVGRIKCEGRHLWGPVWPFEKQRIKARTDTLARADNDYQFLEEWEIEMKKRRDQLLRNCKNHPSLLNWDTKVTSLLWQKESHLAYCRHGKAGTSTWIRLFFKLSNLEYISQNNPHQRAPKLFSPPKMEESVNTIYFTVVRHPFTRLVSAYRDKMAEGYKKDLQRKIIKNYRKPTQNFNHWKELGDLTGVDVERSPTFREFIIYIVKEIEDCSQSMINHCYSHIDVHWKPFYARCSPCGIPYDVISKIETFDNDLRYIRYKVSELLQKENIEDTQNVYTFNTKIHEISAKPQTNLLNDQEKTPMNSTLQKEDILHILDGLTNITREHKSEGISTNELTRRLLALLSEEEKNSLIHAYRFDFLLFDYDPHEFD